MEDKLVVDHLLFEEDNLSVGHLIIEEDNPAVVDIYLVEEMALIFVADLVDNSVYLVDDYFQPLNLMMVMLSILKILIFFFLFVPF